MFNDTEASQQLYYQRKQSCHFKINYYQVKVHSPGCHIKFYISPRSKNILYKLYVFYMTEWINVLYLLEYTGIT